MGLLLASKTCTHSRVKHTFNAEGDTERLIQAAHRALKDKTEFINRCIRESGPDVLNLVNAERNAAVEEALRETSGPRDQARSEIETELRKTTDKAKRALLLKRFKKLSISTAQKE